MTFKINGYIWQILFVYRNNEKLRTSAGTYTVGACDRNDYTVYLSEDLQGEFLRKVLCHELCHCAIWSYGIELTEQEEELLCDFVATYGRDIYALTDNIFGAISRMYA